MTARIKAFVHRFALPLQAALYSVAVSITVVLLNAARPLIEMLGEHGHWLFGVVWDVYIWVGIALSGLCTFMAVLGFLVELRSPGAMSDEGE